MQCGLMTSDANLDWIISTILDLRDFALRNELAETAAKLDAALEQAEAEIRAKAMGRVPRGPGNRRH